MQIPFRKKYFDAIRAGTKTTTLRRWKSCSMCAGDIATTPRLGRLRIISCKRVELKDLRGADARADGFGSLADLRQTLDRIYPDQKGDGKAWYRIEFKWLSKKPTTIHSARAQERGSPAHADKRDRLAESVRALLDKAVQRNRS